MLTHGELRHAMIAALWVALVVPAVAFGQSRYASPDPDRMRFDAGDAAALSRLHVDGDRRETRTLRVIKAQPLIVPSRTAPHPAEQVPRQFADPNPPTSAYARPDVFVSTEHRVDLTPGDRLRPIETYTPIYSTHRRSEPVLIRHHTPLIIRSYPVVHSGVFIHHGSGHFSHGYYGSQVWHSGGFAPYCGPVVVHPWYSHGFHRRHSHVHTGVHTGLSIRINIR